MKVTFEFNSLKEALSKVERACNPVDGLLSIGVKDSVARFSANNGSIAIDASTIVTSHDEDVMLVVNGRHLSSLINKMPESSISFELKKNKEVQIYCEDANRQIGISLPVKSVDAVFLSDKAFKDQDKDNIVEFTIDTARFKFCLHQSMIAVKNLLDKPELSGVRLEKTDDSKLRIFGFDRSTLIKNIMDFESSEDVKITMTMGVVYEIIRLVNTKESETTTVKYLNNIVQVINGNTIITGTLINASYPDLETLISKLPHKEDDKVVVSKSMLIDACDRALLVDDSFKKITFFKNEQDDNKDLIVHGGNKNSEFGVFADKITDCIWSGSFADGITFNAERLKSILSIIQGEGVTLNTHPPRETDNGKIPFGMKIGDSLDPAFTAILTPIGIN